MKQFIPILLAASVGLLNIPFVYGFKKAYSANPFIYAASFNIGTGITLMLLSIYYGKIESGYFQKNYFPILLSVISIVLINIVAYKVINDYGASFWMIASLSNVIVPALVVGILLLKEKVNLWIVPSVICALLSLVFFQMSKR